MSQDSRGRFARPGRHAQRRSALPPGATAATAAGPDAGGSLPRALGWTVLGALVPGTGLIPTRRRRLGLGVTLAAVILIVAAVAVFAGADVLALAARILASRTLVTAIALGLALMFLAWAAVVLLTNRTHNVAEQLHGARRGASVATAVTLVVAGAVPIGVGLDAATSHVRFIGSDIFRADGGPFGGEDPWQGVGRINVLLLGQDEGDDRTGTRPDTIIVASIDTENGNTALFSVPRNLEWVEFPAGTELAEEFPDGFDAYGDNYSLINAVWTYAEDNPSVVPGSSTPGLDATIMAVEETLGLGIDYYAMVNLQGFEDIIDALGGVELNVERRIPIGGGLNEATGRQNEITGYIERGPQTLDGYEALWYARSREGSDDFNRICRQQRLLRALSEQLDPVRIARSYSGLLEAVQENVRTNVPTSEVDDFAQLAVKVQRGEISSYPITPDVTNPGWPDWEYLEQWVQESIIDSDPSGTEAQEAQRNGASESGGADSGGATPDDGAAGDDGTSDESTGAATDGETDGATDGETASEGPADEQGTAEQTSSDDESVPGVGGTTATETAKPPPDDPLWPCMPGFEQYLKTD